MKRADYFNEVLIELNLVLSFVPNENFRRDQPIYDGCRSGFRNPISILMIRSLQTMCQEQQDLLPLFLRP